MINQSELSAMSEADLKRHLDHYLGITAFWDEADRQEVRDLIARLEHEQAARGGR